MKQRLLLSALGAIVAAAAIFFAGRGCSPDPQVVERIVEHRVTIPAETVYVPGRPILVREKPRTDSSRTDSTALTARHEHLDSLVACISALELELAQYGWLTATLDSALQRIARVSMGDQVVDIPIVDPHHVEYDFPPTNAFRLTTGEVEIRIPDTLRTRSPTSRAWWMDALVALAGAAAAYLTARIK
jgi:hypothetical protein